MTMTGSNVVLGPSKLIELVLLSTFSSDYVASVADYSNL